MRYQYKLKIYKTRGYAQNKWSESELEGDMNSLGMQGFECFSVMAVNQAGGSTHKIVASFKRPIADALKPIKS